MTRKLSESIGFMRNHLAIVVALFLFVGIRSTAVAETWTTPDGFLSVEVPDSKHFQALPSPLPPILMGWISQDETLRLAVLSIPILHNASSSAKLIQSETEAGLSRELGVPVSRLPTRTVAGYEVWSMTAKSAVGEVRQAIIRGRGTAYKLMAFGTDASPDNSEITRFMDSLVIHQPAEPSNAEPVRGEMSNDDVNKWSGQIGLYGIILLVAIGIYQANQPKKPKSK